MYLRMRKRISNPKGVFSGIPRAACICVKTLEDLSESDYRCIENKLLKLSNLDTFGECFVDSARIIQADGFMVKQTKLIQIDIHFKVDRNTLKKDVLTDLRTIVEDIFPIIFPNDKQLDFEIKCSNGDVFDAMYSCFDKAQFLHYLVLLRKKAYQDYELDEV